MSDKPLGRRTPTDFKHVQKYGLKAIMPTTVLKVEKTLLLPYWHWQHDQGSEGACVGFACSFMLSVINEMQARSKNIPPYIHKYNSKWLWDEAKKVDEWPETNPGDDNGTSVRAACDVLRTLGHERKKGRIFAPAALDEGIKENRWAVTVDEIRSAIAEGKPVTIGVNWYSGFDKPQPKGREFVIGEGDLGYIRGGHAICLYGASDRRQAFKLKNSWGKDYPLVWLPYAIMSRLLKEDGEAVLVSDR